LADATIQEPVNDVLAVLDIQANIDMARAVADGAKTLLSQKGFVVTSEECSVSLGAIFHPNPLILTRANKDDKLSGSRRLAPPYTLIPRHSRKSFPN
jgi:hypothetical protein